MGGMRGALLGPEGGCCVFMIGGSVHHHGGHRVMGV